MTATGTWRACAAAATGASHAEQGVGNCDAHRVARYGTHGLALVVADGVGSSAEAAAAAAVAVAAAARSLERHAPAVGIEHPLAAHSDHARSAVVQARAAVRELKSALDVRDEDLGTTLLVCLLGEDGATFAGLGDGFLALRASAPGTAPRHHLLSLGDDQPGAVNETATLLRGGATRVKSVRDPYLTGAALATDGMEALAIDDADAWTRLRAGVIDTLLVDADGAHHSQQLYRGLLDERWDQTSSDDRTIILAVRP